MMIEAELFTVGEGSYTYGKEEKENLFHGVVLWLNTQVCTEGAVLERVLSYTGAPESFSA